MIRRLHPLPLRPLVVGAAALAGVLVLTSCSTVSSDAARVEDASISTADFEEVLSGLGEVSPGVLVPSGAYSAASARGLLTNWITSEVLRADLARRGIEVTDDDRAAVEARLAEDPSWADASPAVQDFFVEVNTVQEVFNQETGVSEEELAASYAEGPESVGVACIRALIIATEDEAADALARIESGEPFADVASEVSLDPSAVDGGALIDSSSGLPCFPWETFATGVIPTLVEPLADAAPGEVLGPITTDSGVVLMQVRPFDEVADAVRTMVGGQAAVAEQTQLVLEAEPYVAPRFGRWDPANGAVVELG